ncbi:MAG: CheR family methyltransferase, partial [Bdellovibrionota bacterium]
MEEEIRLDNELKDLLDVIYEKYSYDFRGYAMSSVKRRLKTAMTRFGVPTVTQVKEQVQSDPTFFTSLLQYLTVPTSEMFRDPTFFLNFRQNVVPILETYPSLKIWIAGCSTGEEVYSYA